MRLQTNDQPPEPQWIGDVLVARCAKCWEHPGSKYDDGSGLCDGCNGTGWRALAQTPPASEEQR